MSVPAITSASEGAIVHSVFFRLKHAAGSSEEQAFKAEAERLGDLPGVRDFAWVDELSPKNDFDYGLVMTFADQAAYDAYNIHPAHVRFVQKIWIPNVADFLEIDWRKPAAE
ncbi:MAG: Dabb family protein [Opitutales bacterium]